MSMLNKTIDKTLLSDLFKQNLRLIKHFIQKAYKTIVFEIILQKGIEKKP